MPDKKPKDSTSQATEKAKAEFRRRPSQSLDSRQRHLKTLADEVEAEKKRKLEKQKLQAEQRTARAQKRSLSRDTQSGSTPEGSLSKPPHKPKSKPVPVPKPIVGTLRHTKSYSNLNVTSTPPTTAQLTGVTTDTPPQSPVVTEDEVFDLSESIHEFKISQENISSTVDTILEVSNIEQNISSETEQSETNSNAEQNTSTDTKYTEAADQSQASSDYSHTTEQPSEGSVEPPTVDIEAENIQKQKEAQDKHEQEKLADTITQLINRNNETKREIREQEKQLKQFQGNQAVLTDIHLLTDVPTTLEGLQQQEQELAKALKTQELKVTKIKLDRLQKQQEEQEEIDALLLNNSTLKQQIRHINLQLRALDGPTAEQANENLLTLQPDTKDELVDQAAELTSVIKQFQAKIDKLQQDKDDQHQQQLIDDAQKEQDRLQAEQNRLQQEQEAKDKAKQEHDQLVANVNKATEALQAAQLQKQQLEQQAKQAAQNAADAKFIQDKFDLETLQAEQALQDAQTLKDNLLAQQQNYTQNQTSTQQNPVQPPTQQIPSVTQHRHQQQPLHHLAQRRLELFLRLSQRPPQHRYLEHSYHTNSPLQGHTQAALRQQIQSE